MNSDKNLNSAQVIYGANGEFDHLELDAGESNVVEHPDHYASGSLECIDWIRAMLSMDEYRGYLKGNMLKYLWRYDFKGKPVEDLKKCKKYCEFLIEDLERRAEEEA